MAAALAVISFICAALLAVFIPVKRVRNNVPHLAVILWLVGYNLVRGINAVVWDGNIDHHAPVWCDIVTKLMLGANIALPGAFLCIARDLEHASSSRPYVFPKSTIRNQTILELVLCYVIPLIYMLLRK
ncbi:STE3-like pheromone receptor [Crepidotus variabilis]|uniref:STE3-like pheromone receptor n=1 Tax=Crepidotus variabilis TaxID=179855 RepID=A0A9P6JJ31_9AGAR|nr:STE3-like pheromone receptor [Crepidotus variabilis]